MIKKTTTAIFDDGNYKGKKDWKGGIPLSEGEIITVNNQRYILYNKTVEMTEQNEDQIVEIVYHFKLE